MLLFYILGPWTTTMRLGCCSYLMWMWPHNQLEQGRPVVMVCFCVLGANKCKQDPYANQQQVEQTGPNGPPKIPHVVEIIGNLKNRNRLQFGFGWWYRSFSGHVRTLFEVCLPIASNGVLGLKSRVSTKHITTSWVVPNPSLGHLLTSYIYIYKHIVCIQYIVSIWIYVATCNPASVREAAKSPNDCPRMAINDAPGTKACRKWQMLWQMHQSIVSGHGPSSPPVATSQWLRGGLWPRTTGRRLPLQQQQQLQLHEQQQDLQAQVAWWQASHQSHATSKCV